MRKNNALVKAFRKVALLVFMVVVTYEAYMHQIIGGSAEGSPSIHALCPYGALESLYQVLFSGAIMQKIYVGTFILLIASILVALVFRRSFCGLICPFGAIQEFFGAIGLKLFGKRFKINTKLDKYLRFLKYIVLIVTAYAAWKTGELWMSEYDPWAAYAHLTAGYDELILEYGIGLAVLIVTIIGSMFFDRVFCKYLCPMGAFLGIISKLSPNKIHRSKDTCINCDICSRKCPMNIKVSKLSEVKDIECINCQSCTLSCPVEGALENKIGSNTIKPLVLILITFTLFFGTIGVTKVLGYYSLLPEPIQAGSIMDSSEVKGYMTLDDISLATGISIEELYEKLGLSSSVPSDMKMKEIKNIDEEFEVESVRILIDELK